MKTPTSESHDRPPEPDTPPTAPADAKPPESKGNGKGKGSSKPAKPPADEDGDDDAPATKTATPPPATVKSTKTADGLPALPVAGDVIFDRDDARGETATVTAVNNTLRGVVVPEKRFHITIKKNGHECNLNESELRARYDLEKTKPSKA